MTKEQFTKRIEYFRRLEKENTYNLKCSRMDEDKVQSAYLDGRSDALDEIIHALEHIEVDNS